VDTAGLEEVRGVIVVIVVVARWSNTKESENAKEARNYGELIDITET